MSSVAVFGAGPIGAAIAYRLAQRGRVRRILLIDANVGAASGKALDIQQCGPVDGVDVTLSATADPLAAVGAPCIVIADDTVDGEWQGDRAIDLVDRLQRSGSTAPLVFAGPGQTPLIEQCFGGLDIPAHRLLGTASSAIVGAVRALAGLELNVSDVELTVVGRAPSFVVGWSAASAAGSLLTGSVSPHRILAISGALPRFWPPGPQAIASATALVCEALLFGSRRLQPATAILEGEFDRRGVAAMLPLELGRGRILSKKLPSLSPQEQTDLVNSLR
jgi:malate dehydrogenase